MSFATNPVLIDKLRRAEMRRIFSVYGSATAIAIYLIDQGGITQKQAVSIAWDEVANEPKCLAQHLRVKWHIDRILNGKTGQTIESRPVSATELVKRLNAICI
tara:strand:- start:3375 stop:3683 length:309 start_codon:yes stop_codon:yes gene_type:complete